METEILESASDSRRHKVSLSSCSLRSLWSKLNKVDTFIHPKSASLVGVVPEQGEEGTGVAG